MNPAEPLSLEHRLIERMLRVMRREISNIKNSRAADVPVLSQCIDFLRVYADRCHHGKEEDILFRALAGKTMRAEHTEMMEQLIKEHQLGRHNVRHLDQACRVYEQGNLAALDEIIRNLEILVDFYPKHIDKEDNHFFTACLDYFTDREQKALLDQYATFDRKLIHEKYDRIVTALE